jgi:charged multivesicular body protein 6
MGACTSTKSDSSIKKGNNISQLSKIEQSILESKKCRDKLKQYIKTLHEKESFHKNKAKELLKQNNKDRAKTSLAQSKMYKIQAENSSNQLLMIEDQIIQIESTKNQAEVFKVLEKGNAVLKKLQEEVNIEKLEAIADDMQENRERNRELQQFFQNQGLDLIENEAEIDKELASLENQIEELKLPEVNKPKKIIEEENKAVQNKEEINSGKNLVEA